MRIQLSDRSRLVLTAVILAIFIVVAGVSVGLTVPSRYLDRLQWKWVRFGGITVFFIVYSLKMYWRARNSTGFWGIFLSFLLLHLLGVGHLYSIYSNGLGTFEIGFLGGLEFGCMSLAIYWVLGVAPDVRRQHSRSRWIPTL
jgi:Na+/proline symporter